MKFIVDRTSSWHNEKPCKEAKRQSFTYLDHRTCKTLKEARESGRIPEFFESGTNHREEDGMIVRDIGKIKYYTIELNSMDELTQFIDKYGEVVISAFNGIKENVKYKIEIYDSWRE